MSASLEEPCHDCHVPVLWFIGAPHPRDGMRLPAMVANNTNLPCPQG